MCLLRSTATATATVAAAAAVWWFGGWWIAAFTGHWVHCHLLITLHWDIQYVIMDAFTATAGAAVKLVTAVWQRLTPPWLWVLLATSKTIQCLSTPTQVCYYNIRTVHGIGTTLFTHHFGDYVSCFWEARQNFCSFLYCLLLLPHK